MLSGETADTGPMTVFIGFPFDNCYECFIYPHVIFHRNFPTSLIYRNICITNGRQRRKSNGHFPLLSNSFYYKQRAMYCLNFPVHERIKLLRSALNGRQPTGNDQLYYSQSKPFDHRPHIYNYTSLFIIPSLKHFIQ